MAAPTVTVEPDQATPYMPGDDIVLTWTVVDADTGTVTINYTGTDSEGNAVNGDITITREDTFTMDSITWEGSSQAWVINNTTRSATSVVPTA